MTHTPGPWKIGKRFPGRIIRGDRVVALCTPNGCDDSPNAEEAANARLIAAAPAMHKAIERAIARLKVLMVPTSDDAEERDEIRRELQAALAQAERRE